MNVFAFLFAVSTPQQAIPVPPMPEFPPCVFDRPAQLIERKADLPADAVSELDRLFRDNNGIADASAYFEATDFIRISDAPRRRFLRAYQVGDIWFIWFERGGFARSHNVVALRSRREGDDRVMLNAVPGSYFSGDLCAASKAFLAGVRSAG